MVIKAHLWSSSRLPPSLNPLKSSNLQSLNPGNRQFYSHSLGGSGSEASKRPKILLTLTTQFLLYIRIHRRAFKYNSTWTPPRPIKSESPEVGGFESSPGNSIVIGAGSGCFRPEPSYSTVLPSPCDLFKTPTDSAALRWGPESLCY